MSLQSSIIFPLAIIGISHFTLSYLVASFDPIIFLTGTFIGLSTALLTYFLARFNQIPSFRRSDKSTNHDPYGHAALLRMNLTKEDDWINEGYWETATNLTEACEDLAMKLANFAGLKPGDRLEEVGYGYGDSLPLWIKRFSPSHIRAITYQESHFELAKTKIPTPIGGKGESTSPSLDLRFGDVLTKTEDWKRDGVDCVLALETAQVINTRADFFKTCFDHLRPGGTLGLTDVLLSKPLAQYPFKQRMILKFVLAISSMPPANVISLQEYPSLLSQAGFVDIEILDLTNKVYLGIAEFIENRDKDPAFEHIKDFGWNWSWLKVMRFGKSMKFASQGNMTFAMVRAKKPDGKSES